MVDRAPSFRRFRPTVVLPGFVESDMLTRALRFHEQPWRNTHSYLFYVDVSPQAGTRYHEWKVREGYFFHLEWLRLVYPETDSEGLLNPVPLLQLFHGVRHRELYEIPVDMRLHTSPAGLSVAHYAVRDNTTFLFSDWVKIEISGMTVSTPEYVRIAALGVNIPRRQFVI